VSVQLDTAGADRTALSRPDPWCAATLALGLLALFFPLALASEETAAVGWFDRPGMLLALLALLAGAGLGLARQAGLVRGIGPAAYGFVLLAAAALAMVTALGVVHDVGSAATRGFWLFVLATWLVAWRAVDGIAAFSVRDRRIQRPVDTVVPAVFGLTLLFLWEVLTVGFGVPQVLLPAPSMIGERIASSTGTLWADFEQTFIKAVLSGYVMGCAAGLVIAVLVDRVPFLKRGLLPLGNLVSALPIVGIAPIMVMWFGFDWESKAAVVVVMTFFPMLVNTVAGLGAADAQQRELMRSYAAGYWQTLVMLRLPSAMPFIFNALKINSTLALIGAIVAEFFGTPTVGMGFRISTEVGRMNVDMVWAEIAMAALAGSAFYGAVALIERAVTFWHPSYRQRR
jgi:NitT/TauT family transport system permease protein